MEENLKTVFVLDHTPYFGISSEEHIFLDLKSKIPIPRLSKSLWTFSVESSVEYCRIVWDLFPIGKLIRFVISDKAAHIVNTWASGTQNLNHILNAMAMVGAPRSTPQTTDFTVIHGLRAAIEALAEPTDQQRELMQKKDSNAAHLPNRGRVICITSARDNPSMSSLENIFLTVMLQQNAISSQSKNLLNIDFCHLVIINLYPSNMESMVTFRAPQDLSPNLRSEIHSNNASKIAKVLMHLILQHYNLASTTVTGIPMKEEQNSSSSANYDVEIFHESRTHSVFLGSELALPRSVKEGFDYETVTLKWCTPRAGTAEMQPCLVQHRVTPVDVTSRPSSCLINFLLNGRSVLLEMPRKSGGKITSHLLSAHGGEIFIHSLNTSRSCLEDTPSISEGIGGKIVNYRIPDFVQLVLQQRLVPLKTKNPDENLGKLRARIHQQTRYWPLTFGSTVIFNIRQFVEPILVLCLKDELTEEEVVQCKQCIYHLVGIEARHELTLHNHQRAKGSKKDDQYRLMWNELEVIVGLNGKSSGHKAIMQCIRECRAQAPETSSDKSELDQALRKLLENSDSVNQANIIRSTTDSPMSPPPHAESSSGVMRHKTIKHRATMTLFDMVMAKDRATGNKRLDFSGRLATPPGQIAILYPAFLAKEAALNEVK
ncbi:unnamed protein product [Diamesa serratosioi]